MVTYQVEAWATVLPEIQPYFLEHWKEIAMDQDTIPLDPDWVRYQAMADRGELHVVTVRTDTLIVGYWVGIVAPHLHYKSTLHAFCDVYWLHPDYRKGLIGYRLFQVVEQTLQARGVVKMLTGTKVYKDMGRLFERLGWRATERLYSKVIPDGPIKICSDGSTPHLYTPVKE